MLHLPTAAKFSNITDIELCTSSTDALDTTEPEMDPAPPAPTRPTIADHLRPYQVPPASYPEYFNSKPNDKPRSRLVASAVVIHSGRVLLLQRAAHAFQPLVWELPGGRCEARDESVIASAVRELWEESGLAATQVVDVVGEYEWLDRGEPWKKITFLMVVERSDQIDGQPQVILDPKEQASFAWATEEEVIANECGTVSLNWTSDEQRQMVLDAFRLLR